MKPDIGQRGFGVRIIRNDFDLTEYLLVSRGESIVQRLSTLPREAGLFYIRRPDESMGQIFSITDKTFPSVMGDGRSMLGDLILKDHRARIIAGTYFARLSERLNDIPKKGERVFLSECGNHCQGAIFHNGSALRTEALTLTLDRIAKQIPDFYFGRFDVRYRDEDSLRAGLDIEILEVNGAGAEATHIWDRETRLLEAYRVLFLQWKTLFAIGSDLRSRCSDVDRIQVLAFLAECWRVNRRKGELVVSS